MQLQNIQMYGEIFLVSISAVIGTALLLKNTKLGENIRKTINEGCLVFASYADYKTSEYLRELQHIGYAKTHVDGVSIAVPYISQLGEKKFIVIKKQGIKKPSGVVRVFNGKEDVTAQIDMLSDRGYNFHGIPTTPKMLGFTELTFSMMTGNDRHFGESDIINIR